MLEILNVISFMDVDCTDIQPIINLIKNIMTIIQIVIPIGLIIMGSIDLGRAVLSSDDKAIKTATSSLVRRAIAAVFVFFIVLIVKLVMNLIADSGTNSEGQGAQDSTSWMDCW